MAVVASGAGVRCRAALSKNLDVAGGDGFGGLALQTVVLAALDAFKKRIRDTNKGDHDVGDTT